MTDDKSLAVINPKTPADFKKQHNELIKFVKGQLKESTNIANGGSGDYGVIPYTKKKSLLKPGAEKLLKLFGLTAKNELIKEVEDWPGRFVYYKYKCTIIHAASGTVVADATRSCNNREKKHAGKDVHDVANTIEAVAQKRALVAATVQATMASEIFDADISPDGDDVAPGGPTKAEEDPRRHRLMMRLWGTAKDHGWNEAWVHTAVKKKWSVESLTEISNDQIEELTEFITTKYLPVDVGMKPMLRSDTGQAKQPDPNREGGLDDQIQEAELVDEEAINERPVDEPAPTAYFCQGPKHKETGLDVEVDVAGDWCSEQCKTDYWGPSKDNKQSRFDNFVKNGGKKEA